MLPLYPPSFLSQVPCLQPHIIRFSHLFPLPEVFYESLRSFLEDFGAPALSPTLLLSYLLLISIYMSVILTSHCPLSSLKHLIQFVLSLPWLHFYPYHCCLHNLKYSHLWKTPIFLLTFFSTQVPEKFWPTRNNKPFISPLFLCPLPFSISPYLAEIPQP